MNRMGTLQTEVSATVGLCVTSDPRRITHSSWSNTFFFPSAIEYNPGISNETTGPCDIRHRNPSDFMWLYVLSLRDTNCSSKTLMMKNERHHPQMYKTVCVQCIMGCVGIYLTWPFSLLMLWRRHGVITSVDTILIYIFRLSAYERLAHTNMSCLPTGGLSWCWPLTDIARTW